MTKPYAILSDLHLHRWSAFSTETPEGMNSRLSGLLSEIHRAAVNLKLAGGDTIVISGDLFHVRGNIAPSVLNPAMDCFRDLVQRGISFHIIPGNHDLEGRDSERLSSAVTALEGIGCKVYNRTTSLAIGDRRVVVVPWIESVDALKGELSNLAQDIASHGESLADIDVVIHAPINGVILGIPDHGLEPSWLAQLGFGRIFAGHYHAHKVFEGGKVISVGALAHHTWNDVGTRAGFLIVKPDAVEHVPTILPKFVEVEQGTPAEQVPHLARGNFVRVKVETSKLSDIQAMRDYLTAQGALGTIVLSVKKPTNERAAGSSIQAGASMQKSVSDFIGTLNTPIAEAVQRRSLRILAEAEIV